MLAFTALARLDDPRSKHWASWSLTHVLSGFTDRYQAMGLPYPDQDTMCPGQCEGVGVVPIDRGICGPDASGCPYVVYSLEDVEVWKPLWEAAEAQSPTQDGWHFLTCPECGGSGKLKVDDGMSPEDTAIFESIGEAASLHWPASGEEFESTEASRIAKELAEKLGVAAAAEPAYPLADKDKDQQVYRGEPGYFGELVWMSPDRFLELSGNREFLGNEDQLQILREKFDAGTTLDFLFLQTDHDGKYVRGHEGRHRAVVAKERGITKVPVLIMPYEHRVPRWTPEFREKYLRHEFTPQSFELEAKAEAFKNDPEARKAAQAWIDKVNGMFQKHPFKGAWRIIPLTRGPEPDFCIFELGLDPVFDGVVHIEWFQAFPTGKGLGAQGMKVLQDLADKDGISLSLEPWNKGRVPKTKLEKFYRGQGFKRDKQTNLMLRHPGKVKASSYDGANTATYPPVSMGNYPELEAPVALNKQRKTTTLWDDTLNDNEDLELRELVMLEKAPGSIADDPAHGTRRDG